MREELIEPYPTIEGAEKFLVEKSRSDTTKYWKPESNVICEAFIIASRSIKAMGVFTLGAS